VRLRRSTVSFIVAIAENGVAARQLAFACRVGAMSMPVPPDPFVGLEVASQSQSGVSFKIERQLGEGATAVAYFATRSAPEGSSPVVLKVILPNVIRQSGDAARMVVQKESVALGRLNERVPPSPFVVRLLDVGTLPYRSLGQTLDLPWLAIEYVHGGSEGTKLEDRVSRHVAATGFAFEPERAIRALTHITEGLREIHEAGVIHRDLTPNNVLCCGSGSSEIFKISDFGIARPLGVQSTFGQALLGTPGYIAPEQASETKGPTGFYSDIFSVAAMAYFILTGEPYLRARNLWDVVSTTERRSLRSAKSLSPELRDEPQACAAIDAALALATSPDPTRRPQSAMALAASLIPWLDSCPPTRRLPIVPPQPTGPAASLDGWNFTVRHPIGHDWVLSRVGWDADGHCLAASTRGLVYFDGTTWIDIPPHTLGGLGGVRFSTRIGPGRWLLGGDGGSVAEYSRGGVTRIRRGPDPELSLLDASGDPADISAMLASRQGEAPLLCATAGGHWLKPLSVAQASALLGIAPLGDERFLVCGRSASGKGLTAIYTPLMWELSSVNMTETRAMTACSSRPERDLAVAVGAAGQVVRIQSGKTQVEQIIGAPDFSAVCVDVLGRVWAGAAGELWFADTGSRTLRCVWRDASWQAPFVSIFADFGMVFAATADGAILEARTALSQLVAM
jgi:eukaryotic-like serine/threonine-protein kinase